jgi:hypothetical protein
VLAAGFLGGCASTAALYPAPTAGQVAAADSAIQVARQDGGSSDANASRHLRFAEQQLATAKKAAAAQDNRTATLMLARAQSDAELSLALSRKAKADNAAAEAERVLERTRNATDVPSGTSTPPVAPSPGTSTPTTTPPSGTAPEPRSSVPQAPERSPSSQP